MPKTPTRTRYQLRYIEVEDDTTMEMTEATLNDNSRLYRVIGYHPAPLGPRQAAARYRPHGWLVVLSAVEGTDHPRKVRVRKASVR